MKQELVNEIKGIMILALAMLILASFVSYVPDDLSWYTSQPNQPLNNLIRSFGALIAGAVFFIFGYSGYALIVYLMFWSWNKFSGRQITFSISKFLCFVILFVVLSCFLSLSAPLNTETERFSRSGLVGYLLSGFLQGTIGTLGTVIILTALLMLSLIVSGEFLLIPIVMRSVEYFQQGLVWLTDQWKKVYQYRKKQSVVLKKSSATQAKSSTVHPSGLKRLAERLKPLSSRPLEKDEDMDEDEYEEYEEDNEGEVEEEYEEDELVSEDDESEEYEDGEEDEEYEYVYEDEDDADAEEEYEEYEEEEEELEVAVGAGATKPKIKIKDDKKNKTLVSKSPKVIGEYKVPSLDLLDDVEEVPKSKIESDLYVGAKVLENTLASFGVSARVDDIERGPAITRYELTPAAGVKVQKFLTLSDDIALAMKASAVRIVAPIPGKNRVGIEVPNSTAVSVSLKDVMASRQFAKSKSKLTLAIGKDVSGEAIVADLAEMPHLLIAGTTGSGKSICVNGIIMSILLNASPDEVKFVMVDPKMVELTIYNDIPHMLAPTVIDPKKAASVLNWVVAEMESRYKKLSKVGARNIKSYCEKGHDMPYIVVIIDELADLMQVSAKAVEGSIARLAQLSRAVGIHLILATQRPSVDVITGVIKANFPARISFKVASKVDSRTVLDMNGAENLLGKGDLLFFQPGDVKPKRGQGNYVKEEEIQRVIEFIKKQQEPNYDDTVLNNQHALMRDQARQSDELYDEAVRVVMQTSQASVSILQRRLRLGYTRAARLIDMMEQDGIVGPYCGSKARDIMIDREEWLLENSQTQES